MADKRGFWGDLSGGAKAVGFLAAICIAVTAGLALTGGLTAKQLSLATLVTNVFASVALTIGCLRAGEQKGLGKAESFGWKACGWYASLWSVAFAFYILSKKFGIVEGSVSSVIGSMASLGLVAGLGALSRGLRSNGTPRVWLDALLMGGSFLLLTWAWLVDPVLQQTDGSLNSAMALTRTVLQALVFQASLFLALSGHEMGRWARGISAMAWCVAISQGLGLLSGLPAAKGLPVEWLALFVTPVAHLTMAVFAYRQEPMEGREREVRASGILQPIFPYVVAMPTLALAAFLDTRLFDGITLTTFVGGALLMTLAAIRQVVGASDQLKLSREVSDLNRDLEVRVTSRTSQLQALYSLSRTVGGSLDIQGILKSTLDHAGPAVNADAVVINLAPFAGSGAAKLGELVRHQGLGDRQWVIEKLNLRPIPEVAVGESLIDPVLKRMARCVQAPIKCKGRTLGWIAALRWKSAFDETELAVLEGVGAELGAALENARLYDMARQMADIDAITGLLNHRASQERFDFMFNHAQDENQALAVIMIDVNNFKFFNDTYGHLAGDTVLKTVAKALREAVRPHDIPCRYGGDEFMVILPNANGDSAARVVAAIQARIALEGFQEPQSDRTIPIQLAVGYASFPDGAKTRHELLYEADHAMFNAKREAGGGAARRNVAKPSTRNGDSFDLLESMITAVDNKDYYTRAHSEEVTEFALWIGMELGFSEDTLRTIRNAGLLHDVGKIGIPDEILRKPGQLSDEEFEVMKQHPVVGAMIVSAIPGMTETLPGVRHHHEKWDGTGYPDGLAGEQIPLLGRLLAVPDAYSAMTTDRPYRKGMPWEQALERIKKGSGTHFDPTIVNAFCRAIERRNYRQNVEMDLAA